MTESAPDQTMPLGNDILAAFREEYREHKIRSAVFTVGILLSLVVLFFPDDTSAYPPLLPYLMPIAAAGMWFILRRHHDFFTGDDEFSASAKDATVSLLVMTGLILILVGRLSPVDHWSSSTALISSLCLFAVSLVLGAHVRMSR